MRSLAPAEQIKMAKMSVESSVAQLLITGVLHADPHEGNLLYGDDGKLYFLDFGLLSRMELRHMEGMASGILHILSGDLVKLIDDFGKMEVINPPFLMWDYKGKPQSWVSITYDQFRQEFTTVMQSSEAQAADRTSFGELFVELGELGVNYRFTCPPYYILVMRSFVTLEGLAARADPDFNIYSAAVPYAVRRALTPRTVEGRQALEDALLNDRGELRLRELMEMAGGEDADAVPTVSLSSPEDDTGARVVATLQEVLTSATDGSALRRVLYKANSLALAQFLTTPSTLRTISEAFSQWLRLASSAAYQRTLRKLRKTWYGCTGRGGCDFVLEEDASPAAAGTASTTMGNKAGPSLHWQRRVLRMLVWHHVVGTLKAGPRGWTALAVLGMLACSVGVKRLLLLPFKIAYSAVRSAIRGLLRQEVAVKLAASPT